MSIRGRLTLWFGGILLTSLVIMAGVVHYEFTEQQAALRSGTAPTETPLEETCEIILLYGIPTSLLLLGGCWLLLRKSLSPVTALTRAAERIQLHALKERLPRTGTGDELDRLTEVFNGMTARLDDSFMRVREFTLHASHELKTPLTIMRATLEAALQDEKVPADLRETLGGQLDEIHRLTKIVKNLALLAKADAGQSTLQLTEVRIDELLRESFADTQMLASPHGIAVEMPRCEEITLRADRHRLRQLLLNLTDNAIKYNHQRGHVTLTLQRENGMAELVVANTGPGIPLEKLPRVFDRFYRGDPAHGSDVDGCGLGLSIAQWIVTAHRGEIDISSNATLTRVAVRLPLATPNAA